MFGLRALVRSVKQRSGMNSRLTRCAALARELQSARIMTKAAKVLS